MLKLKVEWRHTCPDCGVKLVVDFVTDVNGCRVCPWCGHLEEGQLPLESQDLRYYVSEAIEQMEKDMNSRIIPKRV